MRLTYPQYSNYESIYRIAGKHFAYHQNKNLAMRMTVATSSTMTPRIHRKGFRTPSKRHPGKVLPGKFHSISRVGPGKLVPGKRINPRPHPPPCDNSNDSGFGFDQHVEIQNNNNQQQQQQHQQPQQQLIQTIPTSRCVPLDDDDHIINDDNDDDDDDDDDIIINNDISQHLRTKRRKIENIQIDNDDACSNDAFIQKLATTTTTTSTTTAIHSDPSINSSCSTTKFLSSTGRGNVRAALKRPTIPIQSSVTTSSKDVSVQLQIISQPEQQHRARYQTEGSRGAVKDRSGNGFPIVKLTGYNKPAVLQVFIGTDIGRVAPHMFYQACKVAGKNSTPCTERKIDGTMIIEIEFKPENDMIVTCDCVGILKERNVDVEHRFPDHSGQRSKKKSTKCRMVFRTQLTHDDGTVETLQVCSYPIICTQPPGVPEICKKSLNSCPVDGGLELFIIGKNFLKDTCVVFREGNETKSQSQNDLTRLQNSVWEQTVIPDKEYLQQTHLVCTVPPYILQNIVEPITVHLFVMSSGKRSEAQTFLYTPKGAHSVLSAATTLSTLHGTLTNSQDAHFTDNNATATASMALWGSPGTGCQLEPKHEIDSGMMPPPSTLPLGVGRRPSISNSTIITPATAAAVAAVAAAAANATITADQISQSQSLKTEIIDENSQNSSPETMHTETSLDQFPSPVSNDAVVDVTNGVGVRTSPIDRIRKRSIDIIDMHSMSSLLNDTNNLSNFSTPNSVVDMHVAVAVKQEQLVNSQLQSQILSVAAAAQAAQAAAVAAQTLQDQQTVNKFLSSLDSNMTDLKPPVAVDGGSVNSLFASNNATNSNGIFSTQPQSINNIDMMSATTTANLEQTFSQSILSNNNHPSNDLNQILNMSQNDSSNVVCSPGSASSSSTSIHSPVTQDIILNSEPAASIQSANMQIMQSHATNTTAPTEHITSELILNPTVSPSMMCPSSSDPNNLMVNQVTMANPILNEMNLAAAASQNPQDTVLNSMLINHHSHSSPPPPTQQQSTDQIDHKSASTVSTADAVNNMILNDFIANQERRNISTESTLNALMSLNTAPILNNSQSTVSQILNQMPSNSLQSTTASSQVLTEPQQPPPPQQQSIPLSSQSALSRHLQSHFNEQNVLSTGSNTVNVNSLSNVTLGNLLMNQNVTRTAAAQNEFLHNFQKASTVPSTNNQESLLQAVSLGRNTLEKSKIDGTVEQLTITQSNNLNQGNSTQSTTTIPQEITTMSDQDLISYINPSCFDQV